MDHIIEDDAYLRTLPSKLYRDRYRRWKNDMLMKIDDVRNDLTVNTIDQVMVKYNLTPRDIALLVRLKYFSDEDTKIFGLNNIERAVPS